VLSAAPGSFDSRYFGPVERVHVLGVGRPIWTT
jgi:type IV secretory pathway protease TraF